VWFRPAPSGVFTNNLREQTLDGKPALSWWQGIVTNTGATAPGAKDVVVDQHYRQVASITGAEGWVITQHELLITGHDAWVTVNKPVKQSDGTTVVDSGVQEYDLRTGKAIYTWSALAHIPLSESKVSGNPTVPRDAYHINSIQLLPGGSRGRFLVSMRNTWAGYLVDIATGNIIWRLTVSSSRFTLPANAQSQWQHDIELHSAGLVCVFDDACCGIVGPGKFGPPSGPSRGLLLRLNFASRAGSLVRQFVQHHPRLVARPRQEVFRIRQLDGAGLLRVHGVLAQPGGRGMVAHARVPRVRQFHPDRDFAQPRQRPLGDDARDAVEVVAQQLQRSLAQPAVPLVEQALVDQHAPALDLALGVLLDGVVGQLVRRREDGHRQEANHGAAKAVHQ